MGEHLPCKQGVRSSNDFIKEISYASEGNSNEKVKVKVKILRAYGGCLGDIC